MEIGVRCVWGGAAIQTAWPNRRGVEFGLPSLIASPRSEGLPLFVSLVILDSNLFPKAQQADG